MLRFPTSSTTSSVSYCSLSMRQASREGLSVAHLLVHFPTVSCVVALAGTGTNVVSKNSDSTDSVKRDNTAIVASPVISPDVLNNVEVSNSLNDLFGEWTELCLRAFHHLGVLGV